MLTEQIPIKLVPYTSGKIWSARLIFKFLLFFSDAGCDGTDISEDIDLKVRMHIQSVVPLLA